MTVAEIRSLIGDPTIPFPIRQVSFHRQHLFVNNKVALEVDNVSSHFDERDVTIKNENGEEMGVLTFTKNNANILDPASKRILLSALNEDQFISFLKESDSMLSYPNFNNNYVVLKREYVDVYLRRFFESAPLWGGFSHPGITNSNLPHKKRIVEITAIPKLKIPKKHYYTNCIRAIQQPFAFERFLKFYHLLELSFDSLIVEKIQDLNLRSDSNRIGKLLNEYDQKDIKRLIYLIKEKCTDPRKFIPILNTLNRFEQTALNLFYEFGNEESNPIKKQSSYLTISRASFFGDEASLRANGISISVDRNLDVLLVQITAYVIYRVRCSIAHNKIGEYIFKPSDEKFVAEFAEPLLKEVLIQCFKK